MKFILNGVKLNLKQKRRNFILKCTLYIRYIFLRFITLKNLRTFIHKSAVAFRGRGHKFSVGFCSFPPPIIISFIGATRN